MGPLDDLHAMAKRTASDRVRAVLAIALAEDASDRIVALRASWTAAHGMMKAETDPHRRRALAALKLRITQAAMRLTEEGNQ